MSAATRHPSLDELSAWADGEIADEVERRLLDEHVASCPSCASLVEDFRALAAAQAAAAVPPVPSRLEKRVLETLRRDGRRVDRSSRRFVLPLSAAATLLVGVAALWLVRHQPATILPSPVLEQAPARATAVTSAPAAPQPPPPPPPAEESKPSAGARAKKEVATPQFAPAPASEAPSASPEGVEGGVPGGVLGGVLGGVAEADREEGQEDAHWTRVLPSRAANQKQAADLSKERSDAPGAAQAPVDACPTIDVLEPALPLPGLDVDRARALAERAREAGATSSTVDASAHLTLLVPSHAWTRVRQVLGEAGVLLPASAADAPPGAACLALTLVPAAP